MADSHGQLLVTKREDDVVDLVVDGLSNRETAQKLGLTDHTVSNYLFRIYEKLEISTRLELALYALGQKQQGQIAAPRSLKSADAYLWQVSTIRWFSPSG